MKILRHALVLAAGTLCLGGVADAKPWWMRGVDSNRNNFLPPDEAFRVSGRVEGDRIRIRWVIADGYYLYRQKMDVKAESPGLVVSAPNFPRGKTKTDPYLGTQEIFTQQVDGTAAFTRSDAGAHPLELRLTYQGCAEAGLCYPPINKVIFPSADGHGIAGGPGTTDAPGRTDSMGTTSAAGSIQGTVATGAPGSASPSIIPSNSVAILPHPWEGYAILGGGLAFFLAGLLLRKGRRLALPAA